MIGDNVFKWWVAEAEDAESFNGPHECREDAIEEGKSLFDGQPFYVVEADKTVMSPYVDGEAHAERIMEELTERNEECWGEYGPDDPWAYYQDPQRSLGNAIEHAVAEWLKVHPGTTWSFHIMRNGETFTPVAESA